MNTKEEDKIITEKIRLKFIGVWKQCAFGIKERVKKHIPPRTIQYILMTEGYSNRDKINEIIDCVKSQVTIVECEIKEMGKTIDNLAS